MNGLSARIVVERSSAARSVRAQSERVQSERVQSEMAAPADAAPVDAAEASSFRLDIELEVEPGTTLALLGPNGAGKSTTVDVLAGLAQLDEGRLMLDGRVLDDPVAGHFVAPEHRRVGVVFQNYLLFNHLSVVDNVAFGPASAGVRRRAARAAAQRWVEAFDLGQLADRKPRELSGGQAQRVAIARALASEPNLLLLDEPLAALDVGTRAHLRRVLRGHLQGFAGPRVLITHDPADAFLLADRIAIVEAGRLTQCGTAEDIRRRPATDYAAALVGTNLLRGTNTEGRLDLADHALALQAADTATVGPVLITIHPTAVALHPAQPAGSPRNAWVTRISSVEPLGDTTRIVLDAPLPLSVDVTPAATEALGLTPGREIWASVKATEIELEPASMPTA